MARRVLLQTLRDVHNDAADDLLIAALDAASAEESAELLEVLLHRATPRGLKHVVRRYVDLSKAMRTLILDDTDKLPAAVRDVSRDGEPAARRSALQLVRDGKLGRLAHVATENLSHADADVSRDAAQTLLTLAEWAVAQQRLRRYAATPTPPIDEAYLPNSQAAGLLELKAEGVELKPVPVDTLLADRAEIEAAVLRAFDGHRGRFMEELLRAILLLTDSATSRTLTVMADVRLGSRPNAAPVVRRLQQAPDAESAPAFLLGCTHARLRSHFGVAMSHVEDSRTLDVLLQHTHWLKDNRLQLCMHQVNRGVWWHEATLSRDLMRRNPADAAKVAAWIAAGGTHDVMQDERLAMVMRHCRSDAGARLRVLRHAMARRRGASVELLKTALADADESIARIAARELVRRRPAELEQVLLAALPTASAGVSAIIRRAVGPRGFDAFWGKFDRLPADTRASAGRALMKMIPAAVERLGRRLATGPDDERLKALQMTQECGVVAKLATKIVPLLTHRSPRVRSKAVAVMGSEKAVLASPELNKLLKSTLADTDARVRANAIEAFEERRDDEWISMLAKHARSSSGRERANAIKTLMQMGIAPAVDHLKSMLRDPQPEHRISAMWVLRQVGFWRLLDEVIAIARTDGDLKARRFALTVLRAASELSKPLAAAS